MNEALPRIIQDLNRRVTELEEQNKRQGEVITKLTLVVEQQAEELQRTSSLTNNIGQSMLK